MTVPLLPRPKDPDDDWGQQPAGFFALEVADVRQKLALMEHLAPEGIASPWAQLHFVNWMLEDQGAAVGQEAVQVLKVVVLLQFLGYLEACPVPLVGDDDLGWLGPLLAESEGAGKLESLILWKILGLHPDWNGQIFAGGHPANPFFPAARFYPDLESDAPPHIPAWRKVRQALLSLRGPETAAPLLDQEGEIVDPHLAASLSRYLDRFIHAAPTSGWGVALRAWQQYLTALAHEHSGQAIPVAQLDVAVTLTSPTGNTMTVPFGIYPLRASSDVLPLQEFWICPQCEQTGDFWLNFAGRQTVTQAGWNVVCPQHGGQLQTAAGEPIHPSHYGAYPAPNGTLYVWTDRLACPAGCTRHEIHGAPGSDGMVIHWFNNHALEVRGHLIALETVLLRQVAWMSRKERDNPSPVDIPVSGEYAVLVERCLSHPLT